MEATNIVPFDYEGQQIRTVTIDGETWWVAKDVCTALGLLQVSRAMDRLDDDERGLLKVTHPQNPQQTMDVNGVNEPGLYRLIIASNRPEAKAFKRWITHEVLPAIRKTGGYMAPRSFADALQLAANQQREIEARNKELADLRPKGEFYDTVAASEDTHSFAEVAKMLKIPGLGRNNLIKWLRESRVLQADNTPYQQYMDWFKVIEQTYTAQGSAKLTVTTRVYASGVDAIRKLAIRKGMYQ